jgi:hypothetical protein
LRILFDKNVPYPLLRYLAKHDVRTAEELREGLIRFSSPVEAPAFQTQPVDLGNCYFPDLDNVWEVLDEAERSETGR